MQEKFVKKILWWVAVAWFWIMVFALIVGVLRQYGSVVLSMALATLEGAGIFLGAIVVFAVTVWATFWVASLVEKSFGKRYADGIRGLGAVSVAPGLSAAFLLYFFDFLPT